jgi:allantoin racemase
MRVLLANVSAAEEHSEQGRFIRQVVVEKWRRNLQLVKDKATEITFRFPKRGLTGLDAFMFSYIHHLGDREIFQAVVQAEREGFDAAMITCFHDPMLWDIRQAVDIPVVSIGESSLLLSTIMGNRFGLVTISPYTVHDAEENIARYGLREKSVGVEPVHEDGEGESMMLIDARPTIRSFQEAARRLIARGAEVIVPGCGLTSPALRLAPGAEEEYPNGLTEVDGVPVMDVFAAAIKMAETLVSLKKAGSSWISRKGLYAQATPRAREFGRMVLEYDGPGFWDC